MCAWRAGFCPWPAVSTWPRMVSDTSSGATPARSSAARITAAPEIVRRRVREGAVEAPHRRAGGRCDYDIGHLSPPQAADRSAARRGGCTDESHPGASAVPSSHIGRQCSTDMLGRRPPPARARNAASGRHTSARAALPTIMPDVPGAGDDRLERAAGRAASGRASGGGAMLSVAAAEESAGAVTRRGSTVSPRKRQPPVAGPLRICQPSSSSLAAPTGIGTPSASQSSSATKSRAAGPSGSSRPASGTSAPPGSG